MKIVLVSAIAVGAVAAIILRSTPPLAHETVERILKEPGAFRQMCEKPVEWWGDDPPLPAYGVAGGQERFISAANFNDLRSNRTKVVADLVERLQQAFVGEPDLANPLAGANGTASPILLTMLVDLNAVETLPDLVRIEGQIHAWELSRAAGRSSSEELAVQSAATPLLNGIARGYQRNLLGVMAGILRNEEYGPLRNSDLEKDYRRAMQARSASANKPPRDLNLLQKAIASLGVRFETPHRGIEAVPIPYSESLRDQIVGWAKDFSQSKSPHLATQ